MARIIRVERQCVKYLFLIFIYAFNCLSEISGSGDEWFLINPDASPQKPDRVGQISLPPHACPHFKDTTSYAWRV